MASENWRDKAASSGLLKCAWGPRDQPLQNSKLLAPPVLIISNDPKASPTISFGWSAGDIASALTLVYNLIEALDSVDAATSDYREAVSFLQALKRTLDPLQAYSSWHAYPNYGKEIKLQILRIQGPLERFLQQAVKFEPSLEAKSREGYHRHVLRKLQWYVSMLKKVLELKKKIESHMRVIDTLLQRLTL